MTKIKTTYQNNTDLNKIKKIIIIFEVSYTEGIANLHIIHTIYLKYFFHFST